jgi:flagellar hook-associated protein 3 FlgL
MSVTSINVSRVSTNMRSIQLLDSLRRNTLSVFLNQSRMSTGNRLNAPSDDPQGAVQALNLSEILENQNQILANIQHADSVLSATDVAIGSVSDLLIQAKGIASEMVNSTTDQAQRDSDAELVSGIINEMVRIGNRQIGRFYLFAGQEISSPPFVQTDGGVQYKGDTNDVLTHVDLSNDIAVNLSGAELFGSLSSQVTGFADLNPAVSRNTRLSDLDGGVNMGVQRGSVLISLSSPSTTFNVDLSGADNVGDVIDAMNHAASAAGLTVGPGGQFNAGLNAARNGLQLDAGAGTVAVAPVGERTTARDLGLLGSSVGSSLAGDDLSARLTPDTPISSLFGGAGAALGSFILDNGVKTATIDLSGAATMQDILNKINGADIGAQAEINAAGTGLNVVNTISGVKMHIGEAGGNTATLLGIRSLYGGTKLSSLNLGKGVGQVDGDDFQIVAKNGATVKVDIAGAKTIDDVLNAINAAAGAAGVAVTAGLAGTGNGIQITDATGGAGELSMNALNSSQALTDLGLDKTVDTPGGTVLTGRDTAGIEPDSVFTVLSDLYNALKRGDTGGITDAGGRLGNFITENTRCQGVVGARSQAMTTRLNLTDDAVTATKKMLSDVKDLDYTEAVTSFQQAQTTLQANLLTGSKLMQLSLLDFLQ